MMNMQTSAVTLEAPVAPVVVADQRKGLAIASMVVGIVAAVLGLIPLFGLFALAGGIVAVVLGLLAASKAKKAHQPRGIARAGWIVGVVAIVLGVVGMAIVNSAVNDLQKDLDRLDQQVNP